MGIPISCKTFPGNTSENKTIEDILTNLKSKFKIKNITIVADRGINSKLNLKKIKEKGFEYIVGCKIKSLNKSIQNKILSTDKYKVLQEENNEPVFKGRIINYKNIINKKEILEEKLFCTWSKKRSEKDKKDRERLINKAEKMINDKSYNSKRGAGKYIKTENKEAFLNTKKMDEDAKWDGFYAIQASHKNISQEKVLSAYHTLWKIEESFRIMKSSLEVRPMFHWTPTRIKGHIALCFLAFLFHRKLEIILSEKNIKNSPDKIREALDSLELSRIKIKDEQYFMRGKASILALDILKALKIPLPKPISKIEEIANVV